MKEFGRQFWRTLSSLRFTVVLLGLSMVLVFFGTLDQVRLGNYHATNFFFKSWFTVWPYPLPTENPLVAVAELFGRQIPLPRLPIPGGYLLGLLLLVNLCCAHFRYFRPSWRKTGIALIHGGLVLLLISGFLVAALQKETTMSIDEGGSANYSQSRRVNELVLIDKSDPKQDTVISVPEELLMSGEPVPLPGSGLTLRVQAYFPNAPISMAANAPGVAPVQVSRGFGARQQVAIFPQQPVMKDDEVDTATAIVELVDNSSGESLGTWLVSNVLGDNFPPQEFTYNEKQWELGLRLERTYYPFRLELEDFRHEKYPGTEIPRAFESDLRVVNPETGDDRPVTIRMNEPLRYGGLTFYQLSFANDNRTSILQVVRNPGWTLPYIAVGIVGLGLCVQFGMGLVRYLRKRASAKAS